MGVGDGVVTRLLCNMHACESVCEQGKPRGKLLEV